MIKKYQCKENAVLNFIIKKLFSSNETFLEQSQEKQNMKVPRFIKRKYSILEQRFNGDCIFTISRESSNNKHIVYFHGGALVLKGSKSHWTLIDSLCKSIDGKATYIDYPLVPHYNVDEILDMCFKSYSKLESMYPNDEFYLVGDSAGGLIILSLLQLLRNKELIQPKENFLISPWLDISLSNPEIPKYEEVDLILSRYKLKGISDIYRGKYDISDPLVSPINSEYSEKINIYTGTSDILYPDCIQFENSNEHINMHVFTNLPHVFPLFPIKESKIVIDNIKDKIITSR